jgi:UDP-N-acetylmuramyl tripeptide synthase
VRQIRLSLAVAAGTLAGRLSRLARRGRGVIISGRVTLAIDSDALAKLACGRIVVLVSGTNGKTTTARLLATAFASGGRVATNQSGANMPDGLVAALSRDRYAPVAVLEVDEPHLPYVVDRVDPAAVLLLNLSRDQLDRVGEVRQLEARLRQTFTDRPATLVVANADDVLVTSAGWDARRQLWVGAGTSWNQDGRICPRCGAAVSWDQYSWSCTCDLHRPDCAWALEAKKVRCPDGRRLPLDLRLPGRANRANAVMALATACALGVDTETALVAISEVGEVNGRYRTVNRRGRRVRMLLAKNPAGFTETLSLLEDMPGPVVVAVNSQEADGRDTSWLWDVPFERLRGRQLIACGERAEDVATRLRYAEVAHQTVADPRRALDTLRPGPVVLVANYTAFRDASRLLNRAA